MSARDPGVGPRKAWWRRYRVLLYLLLGLAAVDVVDAVAGTLLVLALLGMLLSAYLWMSRRRWRESTP